ncbi:hypothetical protein HMPREF1434_00977 [Helicobacter pylori GAMchJs124i]|nr:hypothetical protein HMPREF1434_00977 [Helicobacter pylori GAMchJs124i]
MILDYECYYLKLLPFSSGCKNTQTNPSIKRLITLLHVAVFGLFLY